MGYEEIMTVKPIFWSLETFNLWFLLFVVLGFILATAFYVSNKKIGETEEHNEFLSMVIVYNLFAILLVPILIYSLNLSEWEKSYVEDYIKSSDVVEESTINSMEVHNKGADVNFVVDREMRSEKAKLIFEDDVIEPYITYYKNDKYFLEKHKKGGVYFVELHLPKNYSF